MAYVMRLLIIAGSLALTGSNCSSHGAPAGLLPDLIASFDCSQGPSEADEIAIERRLFLAGFDVLNRARLARELRVEFSPTVRIDAIDRQGRIVSVTGFGHPRPGQQPKATHYLYISLYSQPPTQRDAELERELESLASAIPECSMRSVERHSNPASIEWLYLDIAGKTRDWFGQAKREAPGSDTRSVH